VPLFRPAMVQAGGPQQHGLWTLYVAGPGPVYPTGFLLSQVPFLYKKLDYSH